MSPGIPPGQPPEAGETRKGSFLSPGRSAALLDSRLVACRTVRKFVSVVLSLPVVVICYNSPRNLTHLCPCLWVRPMGQLGPAGAWGTQAPHQDGTPLPPGGPSWRQLAQAPPPPRPRPHSRL